LALLVVAVYEQLFVAVLYVPPWAWHIEAPLTRALPPLAQPATVSATTNAIPTTTGL
jgi:hypothetical protein